MERDEFLRAVWKTMVVKKLYAGWLVFVNEMEPTLRSRSFTPGRGAQSGIATRYPASAVRIRRFLANLSLEGRGPFLAVEGATTAAVFEAYVERVLAPTLQPGQVVMVDNLSARKGKKLR